MPLQSGGMELFVKKILLCVTGSIAAYKSAEIASKLVQKGYEVFVVMTSNGAKFISPMVFETLTRNKVFVDMFSDEEHTHLTHISHSTECDLVLVAPATYNIIGKAANGIADDLVSSVLAAADPKKVIFAPAMNSNMYNNPALINNINILTDRGCKFIEPDEGMLACGVLGKGRLKNIPFILEAVDGFFTEKKLLNKNVLITAGATREYIDPIRFISNSSSGLMGVSIAKACRNMGAKVTLVLANSNTQIEGVNLIKVSTVNEMYTAVLGEFDKSDIVFAVAAVSDYSPKEYSKEKIKKNDEEINIEFCKNTDILFELGKLKKKQFLVGFAAESENLTENAKRKLKNKNLDAIVANDLSTFSSKTAKVSIITENNVIQLETKPKDILAYDIINNLFNTY